MILSDLALAAVADRHSPPHHSSPHHSPPHHSPPHQHTSPSCTTSGGRALYANSSLCLVYRFVSPSVTGLLCCGQWRNIVARATCPWKWTLLSLLRLRLLDQDRDRGRDWERLLLIPLSGAQSSGRRVCHSVSGCQLCSSCYNVIASGCHNVISSDCQ